MVGEIGTGYDQEASTYIDEGYNINSIVYAIINQQARKSAKVPYYIKKVEDESKAKKFLLEIKKENIGQPQVKLFAKDLEKKAFELGGSNYNAPIQLVDDYMNNKVTTNVGKVLPSYSVGYKYANLRELFSNDVNDAFIESIPKLGNKLKGFNSKDALLSGVESRSSSPVRILRDRETMQSTNIEGLYPTGEGAGYAGGIVSAAVDGIKVAEKILDKLILKWEWWNEYRSFKGSREDI